MTNPYDEEDIAEAKNYVLWCEGRLEELRRAGLLQGRSGLTETGWLEFRKLIASGFVPLEEMVIWTLKSDARVPPELVEALARMMLKPGEGDERCKRSHDL